MVAIWHWRSAESLGAGPRACRGTAPLAAALALPFSCLSSVRKSLASAVCKGDMHSDLSRLTLPGKAIGSKLGVTE